MANAMNAMNSTARKNGATMGGRRRNRKNKSHGGNRRKTHGGNRKNMMGGRRRKTKKNRRN